MQTLGDAHNFGKRVSLISNDLVFKPRNVFWEWLFLSAESPLRHTIDGLASSNGIPSPFTSFPELRFSFANPIESGTIERLRLAPLPRERLTPEFCESIGQAIGLLTALGVADLHQENVILGVDINNKPLFTPLDLESALETYTLPSQTHLLPSASIRPEHSGLASFWRLMETSFDFSTVSRLREVRGVFNSK